MSPTDASSTSASAPLPPAQGARRPGRPTAEPGAMEQRERLLDAALRLFARDGIADTPLARIAQEVGVTPAMLHYYFKSRDQLLDVLIDERLSPLRSRLFANFGQSEEPLAEMIAMVRRILEVIQAMPWFPALWVREVLSEGGLLRERVLQRCGSDQSRQAVAWFTEQQQAGRLNPELDARLIIGSLVSLTLLPMALPASAWKSKGEQPLSTDDVLRHVSALLTHGVLAR